MLWPSVKGQTFTNPTFEKKVSYGLRGTNPNLDVFFEDQGSVLAIECKFLETLAIKKPSFPDQYLKITDQRRESKWFGLMIELINGKEEFRYLDVAQLIKHYFGLAHRYFDPKRRVELGYVFWEPDPGGKCPQTILDLYQGHRRECMLFANAVAGDPIRFSYYSYFELVKLWLSKELDSEIKDHLHSFVEKYRI